MTRWIARTLIFLTGLIALPAAAQQPVGDWMGTLEVSATARLRLAIHITAGDGGRLQGTMDSVDQGSFGIPLSDVTATAETLTFTVPAVGGRYEGRWDASASRWVGQWSQGAGALPLILTAGRIATAPPPPPLPADWTMPGDAEIARLIDERIAARPGAGIVVGAIDGSGRRVVGRGPARGAAFDGDTLFEIGSMSKVFTALLLADMVRRGEVALDDPAQNYLPEGARMPTRGGQQITLRHLATHRSGLPRLPENLGATDLINPYARYGEADLLAFLNGHTLGRDIDAQYDYSNVGMGLLGYLLARRAESDYETLVRQRITGPLGMADTAIALSPAQRARFATGHDMYMRPTSYWDLPTLAGAGALRSTADDMLTFLAAAIGLETVEIAPAMQTMLTQRWDGPGPRVRTALGWLVADVRGREVVLHEGGTGGFRTIMAYEPAQRRGIVVLTNAAVEPSASDLALHLLVGAPLAPVQPIPPAPNAGRTAITLPVAELDRVVGRYELSPALTLSVTRNDDRLIAQMTGAPRLTLHAEAPLRFFWDAVDAQVEFVAGADGEVTSAVFRQDGATLTGRRTP